MKSILMKTASLGVAKFVVLALFWGVSVAQAQLAGTIRFVVPYPAGGAADQITRLVTSEAAPILGTTIIVDNKPGAAGIIAAQSVATAKPDGTTFFVGSNAPLVINEALYAKLPYDPRKDFLPVAGMGKAPLMLATRPNLGPTNVASLIAFAQKSKNPLSMGSASSGNITHLAGEYAANLMKFKVLHVPFSGSAPAMVNLVGGQIDIMFDALPSSLQQAKAGKIVPLAILDNTRFPLLPNIPTLKESGYAGAEASSWFGVVAPVNTSPEVIKSINRAINAALKKPELLEKLNGIGAVPMPGTPEDFAAFVNSERDKWIPIVKKLGLKAQQ